MKKLLLHLFHGLTLMVIALGFFGVSFLYESNFVTTVVIQGDPQIAVKMLDGQEIELNRGGEVMMITEEPLVVGDILSTGSVSDAYIEFSGDGVLRMDNTTKLVLTYLDAEKAKYNFKLLEGRIWLVNSYSNADVVLLFNGAAAFPGQSVIYAKQDENRAYIYSHTKNVDLGITSNEIDDNQEILLDSEYIINSLYLPQGTSATIFANKVKENQTTIAKLLFSKMVKEFQYSVFNKNELVTDSWLGDNVSKDVKMIAKIRDERLEDIRTRGLKYSSLDASNYQLDGLFRNFYNALTFSDSKVGHRNLEALYDLLYDAQYLFDYGRTKEAEERLDTFTSLANQLFLIYGDELKQTYIERVKREYEYLSFASPNDSLFALRQVLQGIYLDSIKGQKEEIEMKFKFLIEDLLSIGYFAENNNILKINETFDKYMKSFRELTERYEAALKVDPSLVQKQNQIMNNIFVQHPSLYRQNFFTNKLFVENKYLSLLPSGEDKYEEVQSIILQRIDFLSKLQNFFLAGSVPIVDAQNILALLFSEISKIELPDSYQVAIKQLFDERLEDFGVFYRFLNSQEYVSSTVRGITMRERFDRFKKDNKELIKNDEVSAEIIEKAETGVNTDYELGKIIVEEEATPSVSPLNEEKIEINIDGEITSKENEVVIEQETPLVPRVPRVRPSN